MSSLPRFLVSMSLMAISPPLAYSDDQPRPAIRAWVIPDTAGALSSRSWRKIDWTADPSWRAPIIGESAESLFAVRFGSEWDHGSPYRGSSERCQAFQSPMSVVEGPEDYWVFSCSRPLAGGTWRTFYYFTGSHSAPTLERIRWTLDIDTTGSKATAFFQQVTDSLTRRLGSPTDSAGWGSRLGEYGLRVGHRFETREGPLWTFVLWNGVEPRQQLVVERASSAIQADWIVDFDGWLLSSPSGWEVERPLAVHHEVISALLPVAPEMARAIAKSEPSLADLPRIGRALNRFRAGGETTDLVRLAAHRWLVSLSGRMDSTSARDALTKTLGRYGVRFEPLPYDAPWGTYCGSLLDELASRAGANRWVDEAFVEWLEKGAHAGCECGEDDAARVIERGEGFLRSHPGSPGLAGVERVVAEAHETLWSLSRAPEDDEFDPWRLALSGPGHREAALSLYRDAVERAPAGWNLARLERRIRRLEIDVDTAQRAFFCWGD